MVPLYIIIIIIGIICLFFIINFSWTQKIYSNNKFIILLILSLSIPIIVFFLVEKSKKTEAINFGLTYIVHRTFHILIFAT